MIKKTNNRNTFSSLIENRWSPRAFNAKAVTRDQINSILEAATWAPSAFNEQPWRFIYGHKGDDTYNKILNSLVEWNQKWASNADVLVLNIGKRNFSHNNKPNATFEYDLGQSVAFMAIETVNQGLFSHQMSGFDASAAADAFDLGDDYKAVSVIAIGHYGESESLPEDMLKSELAERSRKDYDLMVSNGKLK